MKRRDFLSGCGVAGALGMAAPTALLAAPTTPPDVRGISLSRDRFAALINTRFQIHAGIGSLVNVALVAVEDLSSASPRVKQFSIFLQDDDAVLALPAGSYPVSHRELGTLAMYLEPSAQPGGYRAHFGLLA